MSALDLDLAPGSAGRKEEQRSTFQQRAATAGWNSPAMAAVGESRDLWGLRRPEQLLWRTRLKHQNRRWEEGTKQKPGL